MKIGVFGKTLLGKENKRNKRCCREKRKIGRSENMQGGKNTIHKEENYQMSKGYERKTIRIGKMPRRNRKGNGK